MTPASAHLTRTGILLLSLPSSCADHRYPVSDPPIPQHHRAVGAFVTPAAGSPTILWNQGDGRAPAAVCNPCPDSAFDVYVMSFECADVLSLRSDFERRRARAPDSIFKVHVDGEPGPWTEVSVADVAKVLEAELLPDSACLEFEETPLSEMPVTGRVSLFPLPDGRALLIYNGAFVVSQEGHLESLRWVSNLDESRPGTWLYDGVNGVIFVDTDAGTMSIVAPAQGSCLGVYVGYPLGQKVVFALYRPVLFDLGTKKFDDAALFCASEIGRLGVPLDEEVLVVGDTLYRVHGTEVTPENPPGTPLSIDVSPRGAILGMSNGALLLRHGPDRFEELYVSEGLFTQGLYSVASSGVIALASNNGLEQYVFDQGICSTTISGATSNAVVRLGDGFLSVPSTGGNDAILRELIRLSPKPKNLCRVPAN
ncbi:MAG: hypothetical protein HY791_10175 [Deltaproteobacteria bacterium]|nr:hypothetical protein [Deltaproteobacteria bacterium]